MQAQKAQQQPSGHPSRLTINLIKTVKTGVEGCMLFFVKKLLRAGKTSLPHAVNISAATYSPWKTDAAFQLAWQKIRAHTGVDVYRLYENWKLLGQLKKIPGDILEVGVWKGGSGCLFAQKCRQDGIDAAIYLCDTFQGVVKASDKDNKYKGGEFSDTTVDLVEDLIRAIDGRNVHILKGIFPDDTAERIRDKTFRLCHIDVDTYESARQTTEWVWPRLSVGGAIIYDDYGFVGCEGVTKYVNEIADREDSLLIHNLNGHAILIKRK